MNLELVTEAVTSLGFPIALVIAMAWFIFKLWKQSEARETKLYGELAECRKVNQQAVETLALYADRLRNIETDVKDIKECVSNITNHN